MGRGTERRAPPAPVAILRGHAAPLSCAHFVCARAEGDADVLGEEIRYLLTGDEAGSVRLWDTHHERNAGVLRCARENDGSAVLSILQSPVDPGKLTVQQKSGRLTYVDLTVNPFAPDDAAVSINPAASQSAPPRLGESFCRARYVAHALVAAPGAEGPGGGGGESDAGGGTEGKAGGAGIVLLRDERAPSVVARLRAPPGPAAGFPLCVCGVDGVGKGSGEARGARVAVGYEGGMVAVWDLRAVDAPVGRTTVAGDAVLASAVAPRGRVLCLAGAFDSVVAVADVSTCHNSNSNNKNNNNNNNNNDDEGGMRVVARASLRRHGVADLAWAPDGRFLVSAGWDGALRVWDGRRCQRALLRRVVALRWHDAAVACAAVSPDARLIASGGKDGAVALWHADL